MWWLGLLWEFMLYGNSNGDLGLSLNGMFVVSSSWSKSIGISSSMNGVGTLGGFHDAFGPSYCFVWV